MTAVHRVALTALCALTLGVGACAPAPAPGPTMSPPPTASSPAGSPVESPTASSPEPTVEPSPTEAEVVPAEPTVPVVPTEPPPSPTAPAEPPSEPPPAPTAPAPSTAGGLTAEDVAVVDGWLPTAKPGGPEEGFVGNGTWVHATSPEHSAYAAIALGCSEVGAYPQPLSALEGNLTDEAGHPGVGLTLEFVTPADAQAYFAEWLRQAEACLGSVTQRVAASDDTWVGRRHLDTVWSETVGVRGETVRLLIVQSPDADLSRALDGAR